MRRPRSLGSCMQIVLKFITCFLLGAILYRLNRMSSKQELLIKLKEFTANLRQIKKLTATGSVPDAFRPQYHQLSQSNAAIIDSIHSLFSHLYASKQNDIAIDKLYKQFNSLLQNYNQQLKKQEQFEEKEIRQLRKTILKLGESARSMRVRSDSVSESQSQRGVQIEMVEINQETLHYQRMIKIKEQQIHTIKDRMHDALKVQQDMQNVVNQQGEGLDLAEAHLEDANRNVHDANQHLIEAKQQHIISRKRQACIFGIILCAIVAVVIFVAVKYG